MKITNLFYDEIDTPALLIEKGVMESNITAMQALADRNKVKLRPHIKAHKIPELALLQINSGAQGIATAKISEAEIMADSGIDDIQIANIIVGKLKLRRLASLNEKIKSLSCCVDSIEGVKMLRKYFPAGTRKLAVFIKINSGFERCGINDYSKILNLCNMIEHSPGLVLKGILTHAGQIYSAKSSDEVRQVGLYEGDMMAELASGIRRDGFYFDEVSVGSTPSAMYCSSINGITELRAGNYIFYDMIQVSLGSTKIENCALAVLAQVISLPSGNRAIIDAGSKALALDRGAHSNVLLNSYGRLINKKGILSRLSEEHGIIKYNVARNDISSFSIEEVKFEIGERIRIIPNHACAVTNLFDRAYLIDKNEIIDVFEIKARGKSQ